ncbi:MAG TPA: hypothetical protein VE981_14400 [Planctomycetota bacterium]|nr:hypothetical protein [Planctomycetota bacterium]
MMMADQILTILDACCGTFSFPMLDNGYIYLAATRLSLYRSPEDWALAIEVFGYSPRAGTPDVTVHTFASRLRDRNKPNQYANRAAYEAYLRDNPHNESRPFFPLGDDDWQDEEDPEIVSRDAMQVTVRGKPIQLPSLTELARHGIELSERPRLTVFELARYLAAVVPQDVLATPKERRVSVFPELKELLVLKQWNHPDVGEDERPSGSRTFQQLARVLETGDVSLYRPTDKPNSHWAHWPEGGTL